MSDFTTVFDYLKDLLPKKHLESLIENSNADYGTKKLTAIRQLYILMYAQIKQLSGLREITDSIEADPKLQAYTEKISYSQLSRKNRDRSPDLFSKIFRLVFNKLKTHHGLKNIPNSWGSLKILDSTVIRLSISLFSWAYYRKKVAAVKVHTLLDLMSNCPEHIILTEGIIHDKDKMNAMVNEPGITYIFDRAYVDYQEYDRYCSEDIFFISRLKKNALIEVINENLVTKGSNILSDKEVILGGLHTRMVHSLRIVEVIDPSKGEAFYIVTNRFDLTAEEIADIYRLRWQIELFFKWIKQHLQIKRFYSLSFNAVLNQIYAALIVFCLLKLMYITLGLKCDFLKMLRLISEGLWNPVDYLVELLKPRSPTKNRRRFNWKKQYKIILIQYRVADETII